MVVLTINAPSNDYTVYFDRPIPKPNYIRLLNCSIYNSWYNLASTNGKITIIDKKESNKIYEYSFLPGFYTIKSFAKEFENAFLKYNIRIETDFNTPTGVLYFENPDYSRYKINISEELAKPFNIEQFIYWIRFVKTMSSPTTYFIHCDLIDREKNLFNGKPSSILANFDIKGEAFERIFYKSEPQHVLRETSSGNFVNSINISVKDENGELFNFNGMPITFVLDIN